ncbi:MAG: cell division topological specificity factor MinE [Anaerolineae bacterium]
MSLFERLRAAGRPTTSTVAKQRLKVILEYDRACLDPGALDEIRKDIIRSISKHVRVEGEGVQVTLQQGSRIVAEIPLDVSRRSQEPAEAPIAGASAAAEEEGAASP